MAPGIDWQLLTYLATLDALLVTKKGKISREDVPPPHHTPIELAPPL